MVDRWTQRVSVVILAFMFSGRRERSASLRVVASGW